MPPPPLPRSVEAGSLIPERGTGCLAPSINLHFLPNGEVRTCSRSTLALGRIPDQTIAEIWDGAWRREIRRRLAAHDFSAGCRNCATEFLIEGRQGSIASAFDIGPGTDHPGSAGDRPLRFDLMLSNACNLQCIQCHGAFSSSIRRHRERRPPLVSPYGEPFLEQLADFLPHLEGAQFAGGEPFMVPINYRIWDMVSDLAPSLDCFVITNGTRLTPRIQAALEGIRAHIIVSMDGITREVYEGIRVGAALDEVLANLTWFRDYVDRRGTSMAINFCLMRQNHRDLGRMLLFGDAMGLAVNVLPVRQPASQAIPSMPPHDIRALSDELAREGEHLAPRLGANRPVWDLQLEKVRRWAETAAADPTAAESIVMFRRRGAAEARRADVIDALAHDDLDLHRARLSTEVLPHGCDSSLGPLPREVLEEVIAHLGGVADALGPLEEVHVESFDDDHLLAGVRFEGGAGRVALIVDRDGSGLARGVEVALGVGRGAWRSGLDRSYTR